MKKPELLAPAGNMEALKAAVLAGCDAVYIGGKFFGARNFADNFHDEEMVEAIRYAHLYGVKVYVTMNTIVYEKEVKNFVDYARFLHQNNVDAIIIQDIGMVDLLRQKFPELKLHASTQMHIHNVEGVKLVESLGLERTVIARETPLSLLKEMKEKSQIQLEVFVHGALCVSYSGQCLMSSLLNGRSGNRGTCSQCCRMPYDLIVDGKKVNEENYLLSPKDLNTLNQIGNLIDLGIDSLKIEGRMKRKEYVYTVVSLYRKAIDSYIEKGKVEIKEDEILELKKIFNRGFTKGFLNDERNENFIHSIRPNHMGIQIGEVTFVSKNLVTVKLTDEIHQFDGIRILGKNDAGLILNKIYKDKKLVSKAFKNEEISFYVNEPVTLHSPVLLTTSSTQIKTIDERLNKTKKIKISGKIICKVNHPITLQIWDEERTVEVQGEVIQSALKSPTSKERILEQISKTGATPFEFEVLEEEIDDSIFIPIQILNQLRREALEQLEEKRIYKLPYVEKEYHVDAPDVKEVCSKVAYVSTLEDYEAKKKEFSTIIVENSLYSIIKEKNALLKLPRVMEHLEDHVENLLVGDLGSVYKYKNVVTDFSLNVTNSYTVAFLHRLGVKRVTLSIELNDYQIRDIVTAYQERYQKDPNLEVIVSAFPEAMILKYNLLKGNGIKKQEAYLKDYANHLYKVVCKDDFTTIYHFEKRELEDPEHYFDLGISKIRYHF